MEACIRSWRIEDAPDLVRAINNPKVLDNLRDGIPFPYTQADAEAFIRGMLDAEQGTAYTWAIAVDGVAAGSIGVFRKANIHRRTAEMGYYVAEACWGRGIATLAVTAACDWVFAHTDILRIYAEPFARNGASCRVLEKAGFLLEGVMRKNAVKSGEVLDMKLYARIRE
jgi:[ribosomal protein S5]-alanine N-acetyltransferase